MAAFIIIARYLPGRFGFTRGLFENWIMTFYRKSVWFVKGLKEYTKGGYESAKKAFKEEDLLNVSCEGRSFMVTGGNSGIGKATVLEIAKRGGTVHVVCRSKERGEAAVNEIREKTDNQNIRLHLLDMSQPGEVYKFAENFVQSGQPLHVLINNAGCMVNEREVQDDGLEKNFATNTLGVHILTRGLLPTLEKQQDPRVITVTSGGMLLMQLDVTDLQSEKMKPFDGTFVYAQNKRQQVVMTEEYAKTYKNIHFSTMHPGWADTPAVRSSMPDFYEKMKTRLRTAEQGADTLVWLAASPAASKCQSGLFFQDRRPVSTHLPMAWTKSKAEDEKALIDRLEEFRQRFSAQQTNQPDS